MFSPSSHESLDPTIPSSKESYKFKVTAAAVEDDFLIYNLNFNKEKSHIKNNDSEKVTNNSLDKEENKILFQQLTNSIKKYEHLEEAYITDTDMLKKK